MFKLMKYEFRKQMFSKLIILIGLGLLEIYFLISVFNKDENGIFSAIGLFSVAAVVSLFYVGIESVTVFNRDLRTKQSYMLYLVPQSTYSIVGAKMIAAFLQILLTGLLFLGGIILNVLIVFAKFGDSKQLFEMIKQFVEQLLQIQLDIPLMLSLFLYIFFFWMMVVLNGMFAISLSTTFLANNKFRTPVSILLFLILFRVILWASKLLLSSEAAVLISWKPLLMRGMYLGIASLLLYFATAWMLDKKVSV